MCRMLLAVGDFRLGPLIDALARMADNVNGEHEYSAKPDHVHHDGWGIAYLDGREWRVHRSLSSLHDADEQLRGRQVSMALLHARRATVGAVNRYNLHPFRHRELVFCHNGTMLDGDRTRSAHETDSLQYFARLVAALNTGDVRTAVERTLGPVRRFSSLNAFLASPEDALYISRNILTPRYYQAQLATLPHGVLISSERLEDLSSDWSPIGSDTLVRIDRQSLSCSVERLDLPVIGDQERERVSQELAHRRTLLC